MATSVLTLSAREFTEDEYTREPARQLILEQLSRIVTGSHFRNSKRYPALLTYIVEEALAGRADSLKERTLGLCVFDRSPDYDTNADPVVRVTAGEVRKRLAQYYQAPGHEQELRIDVPLGSYLPHFYRPEEPLAPVFAPALPPEPRPETGSETAPPGPPAAPAPLLAETPRAAAPRSLRPYLLALALLSLLLLTALGFLWRALRKPVLEPGVALFWEQILRSPEPTLIVLGVHSFDRHGNDISPSSHISDPQPQQTLLSVMTQTDMVHLTDVHSYGAVTASLSSRAHLFHTQGAADTTLEQLHAGPFILLGGFNNIWTKRLSQQLRFRFVTLDQGSNGIHNGIQDSLNPQTFWTLDTNASAIANARDYGVVSAFLDPETDQPVLLAAGIGRSGTEAAADFLNNRNTLKTWFKTLPPHTGANVEVVLATDVIEGKHGPPHVIAYTFW